jgi:hypothetical protein
MSTLTLTFMTKGTAVLFEDDEPTWASDDDEDFPTDIGAPDQLDIEDATRLLVYLVEQDILTESESQLCSIEEEDENDEEVIDADFEEVNTPSTTRPS